jgi:hypothetical protein
MTENTGLLRDILKETRESNKTISRVDKRVAVLEERSSYTVTKPDVFDAVHSAIEKHQESCDKRKISIIPGRGAKLDFSTVIKAIIIIIGAIAAAIGGYSIG